MGPPRSFGTAGYRSPSGGHIFRKGWGQSFRNPQLLAGWCWKWSDPLPDRLVEDIIIGDFRFPWESKLNKKPPPGIPEAKYWALDPAGVDQAGTVYSVQGFEMDHVGVIIGPDLVIRNGNWVADPRKNFRNSLRAKKPEIALPYLRRIHRSLLSRPIRSCRVFSTDDETRAYIAGQLVRPWQPSGTIAGSRPRSRTQPAD